MISFKLFLEEKENMLDGIWRELGIDPNILPDYIEANGPLELDNGIYLNQSVWQLIKPINLKDKYVRIKYHKVISPNLNQRAYRKEGDKYVPIDYSPDGKVFVIPIEKLAEMLGRPWQNALPQQQGAMV